MPTPRVHSFHPPSMPAGEAHGGAGTLLATRVVHLRPGSAIRHIDQVVVRPGATIGAHRHGPDNEEIYVVVAGEGTMLIEDLRRDVRAGDIVYNPPGGCHGFINNRQHDVWLVVIEVAHAGTGHVLQGADA